MKKSILKIAVYSVLFSLWLLPWMTAALKGETGLSAWSIVMISLAAVLSAFSAAVCDIVRNARIAFVLSFSGVVLSCVLMPDMFFVAVPAALISCEAVCADPGRGMKKTNIISAVFFVIFVLWTVISIVGLFFKPFRLRVINQKDNLLYAAMLVFAAAMAVCIYFLSEGSGIGNSSDVPNKPHKKKKSVPERSSGKLQRVLFGREARCVQFVTALTLAGVRYFDLDVWSTVLSNRNMELLSVGFAPWAALSIVLALTSVGRADEATRGKVFVFLKYAGLCVLLLLPWTIYHVFFGEGIGNISDALLYLAADVLFAFAVASSFSVKNVFAAFSGVCVFLAVICVLRPAVVWYALPAVLGCCLFRCFSLPHEKKSSGVFSDIFTVGNIAVFATVLFKIIGSGGVSAGVRENILQFNSRGYMFATENLIIDCLIAVLFDAVFVWRAMNRIKNSGKSSVEKVSPDEDGSFATGRGLLKMSPEKVYFLDALMTAESMVYYLVTYGNDDIPDKFDVLFFPWIFCLIVSFIKAPDEERKYFKKVGEIIKLFFVQQKTEQGESL